VNTESIDILLTGDFCPIHRIEELALKGDYSSIFNEFIEVFQGNDLNIVDLECPLTSSKYERSKTGPHQKAHPDCINILHYANVELAVMANNHIMDYGVQGVEDTMSLCEKYGIEPLGIGRTLEDASRPIIKEIKGKKVGFLNFADNEFLSTPDGEYTCKPIDPVRCWYDIIQAKERSDYLIVIVHAGNEFYQLPSSRTKGLYRYFVDIGADAIVSHHTHAFSGYEVYKSKPIFYGLGNFIYDNPFKRNESWNRGYVVKLSLSDSVDFEIIPLNQNNEIPGVFHLNRQEEEVFFNEMNQLNEVIANDKLLEERFQGYCLNVNPMYDAFIEPNFGKNISALRKRRLFPKLMTKRKRLLLLNIIRCESHRDVLLRMLKPYEKQ
jgi:poly-gamma-glutamate synthesis protein (capsule biosynthesis protein)